MASGCGESGENPRSGEAGLAACGDWLGAEAEGEAVVKDEARLLALTLKLGHSLRSTTQWQGQFGGCFHAEVFG